MDYSQFTNTILQKVLNTMAIINNPEVAPDVRQRNQEILFQEVGQSVYAKIYHMSAFDLEVPHTTGAGLDDRFYGLAKVASASVSTGAYGLELIVKNYIDNSVATAQRDAFSNAKDSGKHPVMTRTLVGIKNCSWCIGKAQTYIDPSPEAYHRHRGCDCKIVTEGYKSRNGLLKNYVKPTAQ